MNIGFDAKRIFLNRSGLGNYSRFIIRSLEKFAGENKYFLFTPAEGNNDLFKSNSKNTHVVTPKKLFYKKLKRIWRSYGQMGDIKKCNIDIYHGLSNEIPFGLKKTNIKSVVTIHDLIFMRYPEFYNPIDRKIYERKFRFACENANCVVAISEQTKLDIISFLKIPEEKIKVLYQGCDQRFQKLIESEQLEQVKQKYSLPEKYILYVGTVEERKNLLSVVKALKEGNFDITLVVVGKQTDYADKVKQYIHDTGLENVYFLSNVPNDDLPALYQMAKIFVYPSVFEGFGIPILEALYSKVPVISSKGSCFSEAGGPGTIYINPVNSDEIANAIKRILSDEDLYNIMIEQGYKYAQSFNHDKLSARLNNLYKEIANG